MSVRERKREVKKTTKPHTTCLLRIKKKEFAGQSNASLSYSTHHENWLGISTCSRLIDRFLDHANAAEKSMLFSVRGGQSSLSTNSSPLTSLRDRNQGEQ